MEIFNRQIEAVKYMHPDGSILTIYVKQKEGDCKRKKTPSYDCHANCYGNYMQVKCMRQTPISLTFLVRQEINVHPKIKELKKINTLEELKKLTKKRGYELRPERKGKILFLNGQPVADYNPCGLTTQTTSLPNKEVRKTLEELVKKIEEVYKIAIEKPFGEIIMEPSVGKGIYDKRLEYLMGLNFGQPGIEAVRKLRAMKTETN